MELQSVRALKAEIAERVVQPIMSDSRMIPHFSVTTRSLRRTTGIEAGVALGIAKGKGPDDFRLAVRIQDRALEAHPDLRTRIDDASRHEADFRYVGRITKLGDRTARLPWYRTRQRPLLIGSSIGHTRVTAGTLGGFALHVKSQKPVILSNNHVLADENAATVGDAIIQPGTFDGGKRNTDAVGNLVDFAPLKPRGSNLVDAAIASLAQDIAFDGRTLTGIGSLTGRRLTDLEPGDAVAKVGRTTGTTRGVVTAVELDDVVVSYDIGNLSFDRQIEIEGSGTAAFSDGGDSGSLIVDETGAACGLLFAGGDTGGSNGQGLTYANEINLVLESLNVELALDAIGS